MKPTTEQLDALRQQYGDVFTFEIDDHQVVLRRPSRDEYKRFQKLQEKGELINAAENLGKHALVFPAPDGVEQLLNGALPGLLEVAGVEAAKLARGQDHSAKKYVPSSAPASTAPAPTT